uniref:Polypeptide N-acetylgalactosaminyltransferase n=1 Tax=Colobus angolensis palliatus TaxID=336983 RepID=A0A2K5KEH1_COLAP
GSHSRQKKTFFLGDGQKLKDWHDKEAIRRDAQRVGNGEQGRPYPMTDAERVDQAYRENGFNIYVSDKISLNRSLPDIRHPNCNSKRYLETLPNTSIIIPFHNEGWSSLLRTVHSVLNRSPPELVAEIVLVDDFSDREHLKKPLEDYMALFPSVRILRTKKREGLIRTRMLGASVATGDVITFLDSHCEANVNWLPPLLDRIARNRKTIVCPMIDVIDHDDFRYETQAGDAMRGAFDWEMYYKRIPIPPELQKADPSDPFESPVMAGGLFAVDRKWFWELGGYDPGLEIWGGEQYEISFKVWMCGGRMEDIPCSRVGHIYRKYVPYKVPAGVSLARNLKRVAEVWMDEYAEYIYQRRPEYRHLSAGDVAAQKKLRSSLNCKSFKWFMTKIAWDLPKFYPPVEPPAAAWGEIRNVGTGLCADTKHGALGSPLRLEGCVRGRGEAAWNNMQDKTLYHPVSGSCMDCSESDHRIFMNTCNPSSLTQQWLFEHTNSTVLEKFNRN